MSIVLQSTSGGSVTINEPTTASNFTQTLPAATGTVMVSGNMPAFSAYLSANQNLTSATYTKVTINTETFDTANAYDNTTNYRFTPQVAGYYQISGAVAFNSTGANPTTSIGLIYKNGTAIKSGIGASVASAYAVVTTGLIYLNGSTDYVELYAYASGGTGTLYVQASGTSYTYFDGVLVRTA